MNPVQARYKQRQYMLQLGKAIVLGVLTCLFGFMALAWLLTAAFLMIFHSFVVGFILGILAASVIGFAGYLGFYALLATADCWETHLQLKDHFAEQLRLRNYIEKGHQ